jgi:hypothetical protein
LHAAGFIQAISDMRRAYAAALEHLAEMGHAQTAQFAQFAGYTSQAAFVAELVHINRQKASRMVAQAEQVAVTVTPTGYTAPAKLPTLRQALLDGVIDGEHIDAVADAVKQLPDWATLEHRELVETSLGGTARTHSSAVVREHAQVLLNRIHEDGANPRSEDQEAEPANTFRYKLLPSGRIKYWGEGTPRPLRNFSRCTGRWPSSPRLLRGCRTRDRSSGARGMPSPPWCISRLLPGMLRCMVGSSPI